jgi:hypothetical protein
MATVEKNQHFLDQKLQFPKIFLQSLVIGTFPVPTPSPAGECVPSLLVCGGGGHTRSRERGWKCPKSVLSLELDQFH